MIKTTRIKYSQAPRIIVDDLSPQCDGVKQTFTLTRPVPEWAPYCLVFNGQLYTNTSYKQWFILDADRKTIHTSFITPPTQGPNKSLILIVGVAGMEDLAVTWDDIVNKPEVPTEEEVDAKDAAVLAEAKQYTDEHGGSTSDVTKAYVDQQDAATLQSAKNYADSIKPTKTSDLTNDGSDGNSTYVDTDDLANVALSGSYSDLTDAPSLAAVATSGDYDDLSDTPDLATVATSGSYADLSNKPTIPTITMTTTDPGEGATLAANTFIGVYS